MAVRSSVAHQAACSPAFTGIAIGVPVIAGAAWVNRYVHQHHQGIITGLHVSAAIALCAAGAAVLALAVRSAARAAAAVTPAPAPEPFSRVTEDLPFTISVLGTAEQAGMAAEADALADGTLDIEFGDGADLIEIGPGR